MLIACAGTPPGRSRGWPPRRRSRAAVVAAAAPVKGPPPAAPATIRLSSPVVRDGGALPRDYTCDGAGGPPPLRWTGVPPRARSLALLVEDPDAPGGTFVHWTLWGLPARDGGLAAGRIPPGARQGVQRLRSPGLGRALPAEGGRRASLRVPPLRAVRAAVRGPRRERGRRAFARSPAPRWRRAASSPPSTVEPPGPRRLLGLAVPRLARRALSRGTAPAALARALRRGLRHGRAEHDLLPPRPARGGAGVGPPHATGLRLRGQGQPLPHPREAAGRPRPAASRASTTRSRRWWPRPSSGRSCGSCRPTSTATTSAWPRRSTRSRPGAIAGSSVTRAGSPTTSTRCCAGTAPRW